nr:hybrid sensor histidine kinase/response regulator [uncultured bacterium]
MALDNAFAILIVSPSAHARRALALLLSEAGFGSVLASDSDDALAKVSRGAPHVVMVDLRASGEEELFFVSVLRRRHPGIAVVRLLDGRALINSGEAEQVFDFGGSPRAQLPSVDDLRMAMGWVAAEQSLRIWKPALGHV